MITDRVRSLETKKAAEERKKKGDGVMANLREAKKCWDKWKIQGIFQES